MDFDKLDSITSKMNKITSELTKNIEISEEILTTSEGLEEVFNSLPHRQIKDTPATYQVEVLPAAKPAQSTQDSVVATIPKIAVDDACISVSSMANSVMNVDAMVEDFNYMRSMLRETTQNTKKVLESVTDELMDGEEDSRAGLVMAYGELNKAQLEGIKLFMMSYKEISVILANFAKVQTASRPKDSPNNVYTTNVMNIEASATSSADIINRLRGGSS